MGLAFSICKTGRARHPKMLRISIKTTLIHIFTCFSLTNGLKANFWLKNADIMKII
jgi:hypothetical protein